MVEGYQLIEEIGRGGMGVVCRALQLSTKRVVALKVILAGAFAAPAARRRFEREVELAARLQHASIARILESGDVAGQRYYAMDYVPGTRLDRHLVAAQPDLRSTLGLFVQICAAVDYAHTHGVVHRDLKPANVVIDDEGKAPLREESRRAAMLQKAVNGRDHGAQRSAIPVIGLRATVALRRDFRRPACIGEAGHRLAELR